MIIAVETPRLILRQFEPEDAFALCRVLCDPLNMRFYPNRFTPGDVDTWIDRNRKRYADHGFGLWAAIRRDNDELIGDCGITLQPLEGAGEEHEVGYHLARSAQGRGYATEAARACFEFGFTRLGLARMISLIRPENVPYVRVAQRCGLRAGRLILRGALPHLVFAMERSTWRLVSSR